MIPVRAAGLHGARTSTWGSDAAKTVNCWTDLRHVCSPLSLCHLRKCGVFEDWIWCLVLEKTKTTDWWPVKQSWYCRCLPEEKWSNGATRAKIRRKRVKTSETKWNLTHPSTGLHRGRNERSSNNQPPDNKPTQLSSIINLLFPATRQPLQYKPTTAYWWIFISVKRIMRCSCHWTSWYQDFPVKSLVCPTFW